MVQGALSLNLRDFCDCPDPCAVCCAFNASPCCERDLPETLFATVGGGSTNCPCATEVIELTLRPGSTFLWEGTGPFGACGEDIYVAFVCDVARGEFAMTTEFSNNCRPVSARAFGLDTVCDPLSVRFQLVHPAVVSAPGETCCPDVSNGDGIFGADIVFYRIVVTE